MQTLLVTRPDDARRFGVVRDSNTFTDDFGTVVFTGTWWECVMFLHQGGLERAMGQDWWPEVVLLSDRDHQTPAEWAPAELTWNQDMGEVTQEDITEWRRQVNNGFYAHV